MNQTIRESKTSRISLLVDITPEEKKAAKALSKSKGMTLQGWTAQLIKKELEREVTNG